MRFLNSFVVRGLVAVNRLSLSPQFSPAISKHFTHGVFSNVKLSRYASSFLRTSARVNMEISKSSFSQFSNTVVHLESVDLEFGDAHLTVGMNSNILNEKTFTISHSAETSNEGAITIENPSVTITGSTFTKCVLPDKLPTENLDTAAAITMKVTALSKLILKNTEFITIKSPVTSAGAVLMQSETTGSALTITGCTFQECITGATNSAAAVNSNVPNTITQSSFYACTSLLGNVISVSKATTIETSTFNGYKAVAAVSAIDTTATTAAQIPLITFGRHLTTTESPLVPMFTGNVTSGPSTGIAIQTSRFSVTFSDAVHFSNLFASAVGSSIIQLDPAGLEPVFSFDEIRMDAEVKTTQTGYLVNYAQPNSDPVKQMTIKTKEGQAKFIHSVNKGQTGTLPQSNPRFYSRQVWEIDSDKYTAAYTQPVPNF